jgi:hypothetical protein
MLFLLALLQGCSGTASLEEKAFSRIPKALEKAMEEELSMTGGGTVSSPEVLYSCDSLCIIQFKAVAKDPQWEEYSFPARYIMGQDMVLSHAYGHPVYFEKLTGCPDLSPEEMEETKASLRKEGDALYTFYASTANPIAPKDL